MAVDISNANREIKTFLKYGFVGLINTAVFSGAAWLFSRLGLHYMVYTSISYTIAILVSFILNSVFTFRASESTYRRAFPKFILVTISLLGIVQLIQYFIIEVVIWPELAGVAFGMVFYTGVGFVLNRIWVFGATNED